MEGGGGRHEPRRPMRKEAPSSFGRSIETGSGEARGPASGPVGRAFEDRGFGRVVGDTHARMTVRQDVGGAGGLVLGEELTGGALVNVSGRIRRGWARQAEAMVGRRLLHKDRRDAGPHAVIVRALAQGQGQQIGSDQKPVAEGAASDQGCDVRSPGACPQSTRRFLPTNLQIPHRRCQGVGVPGQVLHVFQRHVLIQQVGHRSETARRSVRTALNVDPLPSIHAGANAAS
jgi:hypothetical protein